MRLLALLPLFVLGLIAQSAAGLRWTPPADWKSEGSSSMRAATYKVVASPGDGGGAECVVYFFGAGQGGGVQQNIDRWNSQITGPDGQPASAQIRKRTVHDLAVTTIDASGNYAGMDGGAQAGYRLLGAIIENPGGNIFLKFVGPRNTIAANQAKYEHLLESFQKQ